MERWRKKNHRNWPTRTTTYIVTSGIWPGEGRHVPFGVAQWFGLVTSMLEVSSSKPLASESKGFAFWVELVAPGLPSAGYLSYVVCELLHRSGGFTLCAPKG
ncbi:hypothetical protein H5410_008714 [Solanum commersonii]|uniref:Uncharacterized protein n=1 Tax=Solanum commersonii TaxID=4109 RepID=A0A9J6AG00_SOLCO|nr:hypothetical protein H5410_008714 [Solanum commersonii]